MEKKNFLFQYHQLDLNKLYRKFTFLQLVILQKTDATTEKSKKYIYKKQYWIDKVSDQEGSGLPWPVMPWKKKNIILLLDNGK